MRKFRFPILIPLILIACGKTLPDGARYIDDNDTTFSADIRSISAKINKDPNNPENYYLRGNTFFFSDKLDDAITDLKTAIYLNDKNPLYHFRIAECYLNKDSANYEEANKHLQLSKSLDSKNPEIAYLLAKLYIARQQYKEADNELLQLKSIQEFKEKALLLKVVSLKEQKDTSGAMALIDKLLVEFPNNYDATMQKALFLLNSDVKMAENFVDKAIAINEFSDEALYTKALILQRKNQYKDAVRLYEKVYNINPNHVLAFYNRAVIEALFDNYDQAMSLAEKVISLNPNFENAYTLRGDCQFNLGNKKAAIESYRAALRINPKNNLASEGLKMLNP